MDIVVWSNISVVNVLVRIGDGGRGVMEQWRNPLALQGRAHHELWWPDMRNVRWLLLVS